MTIPPDGPRFRAATRSRWLDATLACAAVVVVSAGSSAAAGAGPTGACLVAAGLAGCVAFAACLVASRPAPPPVAAPGSVPPAAAPGPVPPVPPAGSDASMRELRHDLRGILSPALMMADRLLMTSEDPLARRTAETMIGTIERAERRLAGRTAPDDQS